MRIDDPQALHAIAHSLLTAPGWARIGITAPAERLREDAAFELARWVLEDGPPTASPDQLTLAL